jgi:hypothetical protein
MSIRRVADGRTWISASEGRPLIRRAAPEVEGVGEGLTSPIRTAVQEGSRCVQEIDLELERVKVPIEHVHQVALVRPRYAIFSQRPP